MIAFEVLDLRWMMKTKLFACSQRLARRDYTDLEVCAIWSNAIFFGTAIVERGPCPIVLTRFHQNLELFLEMDMLTPIFGIVPCHDVHRPSAIILSRTRPRASR